MQGMEGTIHVFSILYQICLGKGRKKEEYCLRNGRLPFPGPKEFGWTHAYIDFYNVVWFGVSYMWCALEMWPIFTDI